MRASLPSEPIEMSEFENMMIRWQLAGEYLHANNPQEGTGELALRALVSRDVPILFREVTRLRPELL